MDIRQRWLQMKEDKLDLHEAFTPEEITAYCVEFFTWSMERYKQQVKDLKRYFYMVTFTVDRKKCKDPEEDIEYCIELQGKRAALQIIKFEYVKEYTKNNVPHWHALVITKKPLAKDRFSHYIKKIGNIDISKSKSQYSQHIYDYIKKEPNHVLKKVV